MTEYSCRGKVPNDCFARIPRPGVNRGSTLKLRGLAPVIAVMVAIARVAVKQISILPVHRYVSAVSAMCHCL